MTEEEKKAVEIIKGLAVYYDDYSLLDEEEIEENESVNKSIELILNLIEKLLKENESLKENNMEYKRILDLADDRIYRKKYLEERRKEQPNLLYPDSDEIYQRYYELKQENEELKEEKINNYRMIALAQNEALGYMQGYEDGKKLKRSAIANIVENQRYYILNEQIEYYKEYIEELRKKNEQLRTEVNSLKKDNKRY